MKISAKTKKLLTDYLIGVAASAVTLGISALMNWKPEYALLIASVTGPAAKWASTKSKDYGRGSQE
jgi:hypothetical protein